MRSNFDTNEYVKSLTVAGLARAQVQNKRPEDAATVADLERLKVQLDAAADRAEAELKRFLFAELYRHPQVQNTRIRAEQVLRDLFAIYLADPSQLPPDHAGAADHPRACADYIAGMTDRFALREHLRLTGLTLF